MCPESATCLSGWGLSHASPERLPEAPKLGKPRRVTQARVWAWKEAPIQARLALHLSSAWLARTKEQVVGKVVWHTGTEAVPGKPNKGSVPPFRQSSTNKTIPWRHRGSHSPGMVGVICSLLKGISGACFLYSGPIQSLVPSWV